MTFNLRVIVNLLRITLTLISDYESKEESFQKAIDNAALFFSFAAIYFNLLRKT